MENIQALSIRLFSDSEDIVKKVAELGIEFSHAVQNPHTNQLILWNVINVPEGLPKNMALFKNKPHLFPWIPSDTCEAIHQTAEVLKSTYVHLKSGKKYARLGGVATDATNKTAGRSMVVYMAIDTGKMFVRDVKEFNTKFRKVAVYANK